MTISKCVRMNVCVYDVSIFVDFYLNERQLHVYGGSSVLVTQISLSLIHFLLWYDCVCAVPAVVERHGTAGVSCNAIHMLGLFS